jgi:hypothetical protein
MDHLGELRASLEASDVGKFYVRCHLEGLTPPEITEWWLAQWSEVAECAAEAGASHVLRLEDDVVVNPHLAHNVATWPGLRLDDFGVGLLFVDDSLLTQLTGFEVDTATGAMRSKMDNLSCGQAQLVATELIPKLVAEYPAAKAQLYHRWGHDRERLDFDAAFTHAAHRLGRRLFVHVPSLVQTSALSASSVLSPDGKQRHSAKRTWRDDWRRPDGRVRDVEPEHLWGYETRWTVLNDGDRGEVAAVRSPPNPQGPQLVSWENRSLMLRSEALFATRAEAEAARSKR